MIFHLSCSLSTPFPGSSTTSMKETFSSSYHTRRGTREVIYPCQGENVVQLAKIPDMPPQSPYIRTDRMEHYHGLEDMIDKTFRRVKVLQGKYDDHFTKGSTLWNLILQQEKVYEELPDLPKPTYRYLSNVNDEILHEMFDRFGTITLFVKEAVREEKEIGSNSFVRSLRRVEHKLIGILCKLKIMVHHIHGHLQHRVKRSILNVTLPTKPVQVAHMRIRSLLLFRYTQRALQISQGEIRQILNPIDAM